MSRPDSKKKPDVFIAFMPDDKKTWPLQKLRVLIRLKPTRACPDGFLLYAVREHLGGYWALRYKCHIPLKSIASWMYAPIAESKQFTPKVYNKETEE